MAQEFTHIKKNQRCAVWWVFVRFLLVSMVPVEMGCLGGKTDEERLDEKAKREANKKIEKQLQRERQTYKATHRLLLLGEMPPSLSIYFCLSNFRINFKK